MGQALIFDTAIATSNQGDEVILQDTLRKLKPILDEMQVYRFGTHIDNFSKEQLEVYNWKAHALSERAKYKFICGTNLLTENLDRMFPVWMLNSCNKILYRNVILVGAGKHSAYTIPNEYTQALYKDVFSPKFKHSVRDLATKQVVEALGFQAINTGCPTLWDFNEEFCSHIPVQRADQAIISVSGHKTHRNPTLDQQLINIINENYKDVYAWIQTTEDERHLDSLQGVKNYKKIYSLNRYREILKREKIDYVGTRLHGGIVALQEKRRSIIISIDQRAEGFHESNNIPIVKRTELEKLDRTINSSFETNILVDHEAIHEFLSQFPEYHK